MADKRSNREKVLNEDARKNRVKRHVMMLMKDNHHEEPEVDLEPKGPSFDADWKKEKKGPRKNKLGSEPFKQRYNTLAAVLNDERNQSTSCTRNYLKAIVPPSKYPHKHYCYVCGFPANYTCPACGDRYCCVKCYKTHKDTRCQKWIY